MAKDILQAYLDTSNYLLPKTKLREYQIRAIETLMERFKNHERVVYVSPRGSGNKTLATAIAEDLNAQGSRTAFLLYRKELAKPMQERIGHVAQAVTLKDIKNRPDEFDFVIVNNAHQFACSLSKSLLTNKRFKVLGITHAPLSVNNMGLGNIYESLVTGPSPKELVQQGYLSDIKVNTSLELKHYFRYNQRAKDYTAKDLSGLRGIGVYEFLKKYIKDDKAVVFCASQECALDAQAALVNAGIRAGVVISSMHQEARQAALNAFKTGEINVLVGHNLIAETDINCANAIMVCRPTCSLAVHLNHMGFAMKQAPNGDNVKLYDFVGNALRFGLPDDIKEWRLYGSGLLHEGIYSYCHVCFSTYKANEGKACPCRPSELPLYKKISQMTDLEFDTLLKSIPQRITQMINMPLPVAKQYFLSDDEIDLYCRYRKYKPAAAYYIKLELGLARPFGNVWQDNAPTTGA